MKINLLMETDKFDSEDNWYAVQAFVNKKNANQAVKEKDTQRFYYDVIPMTITDANELYVIGYATNVRYFSEPTLGFSFDRDKIEKLFKELDELITAFRGEDFEECRKNISEFFKAHDFEFVQDPNDQTLMHPDFIPTSLWVDIVKEI